MKKCNACGEINKDNSKFCIKCGKQLSNLTPLCPNCKSIINPVDVFCKNCGKRIIASDPKQTVAKKETYKYIEKPVVEIGRNLNFKIALGIIIGFATVTIIAVILIFVLDIGNLTTPSKSITKAEEVSEPKKDSSEETTWETATAKQEGKGEQITELPKEELTKDQLPVDTKNLTPGESTQKETNDESIGNISLEDLQGEYRGTGKLTMLENIELYVWNWKVLPAEEAALYNSMVGVENLCSLEIDQDNDIGVQLSAREPYWTGFYDNPTGTTLINGELSAEEKYAKSWESKVHATLSRDTDGVLMLQGTVDTVVYQELPDGSYDEISHSFVFSVKKTD